MTFPAGWERWARRSASGGDFCHDASHAATDYHLDVPHRDTGKMVDCRACGTCFPREEAEPLMLRRQGVILRRLAEKQRREAVTA